MPRFDGTGPRGVGSRTGRGMSPCGLGLGMGCGFGCGMGCCGCPCCPFMRSMSTKEKKQHLKKYLEYLKDEIENTQKMLEDLPNAA